MNNKYIPIETPGGNIWAEVENFEDFTRKPVANVSEKIFEKFEEVSKALKDNAEYLLNDLKDIDALEEVEVSFGIQVGMEAGVQIFALAKASSSAGMTVKLKLNTKKIQN